MVYWSISNCISLWLTRKIFFLYIAVKKCEILVLPLMILPFKQKRDRCEDCGKTFHNRSNFVKHCRAHRGEKTYKCAHPGCGYGRVHSPHVTRHENVHGVEHICPRCECGFKKLRSLTYHMKEQHPNDDNQDDEYA